MNIVGVHDDDVDFGGGTKEKHSRQSKTSKHEDGRTQKSLQNTKPRRLLFRRHLFESRNVWRAATPLLDGTGISVRFYHGRLFRP